jgi:hypothetical protein
LAVFVVVFMIAISSVYRSAPVPRRGRSPRHA